MPHTLRSVELEDETIAELEVIVGFEDDLAGEANRISNWLRGLPRDEEFGILDSARTTVAEEKQATQTGFFLSAFAALADPASRAYYDRKISQVEHDTQALLRLARCRADVLFAILHDGTFYEPQAAAAVT
ncbi:hypothetical protein GCM10010121_058430 [Streptomyces brasiliensis]|uniref:Uncharacterized protein n=1 Tax=Streptomyces brasiliensis TaxID=1954 RepID=A0A917L0V3_9ACTN|nr:hypothetical protein GCM10010121_058430 [Streptomyces brasiliensis]